MHIIRYILFFLIFPVGAVAQPSMLDLGDLVVLESHILGEERSLYVHLPDAYDESTGAYPILVILDGEWNFRNAVAITEHLAASERIPPMIVVGIANTTREGRPARMVDLAQQDAGGGAELFRQFIVEEAMPFIEATYQAAPHHVLAGHSLGGLFAVYAMLEDPGVFDAYIAISPSLGRNNQQQVRRAAQYYPDRVAFPKAFHLSMGNEGGNTMLGVEALVKVLETTVPSDARWHVQEYQKEDHVSVVYRSLYDALEWIYEGWIVPEELLTDYDISIVQRHYQALSERLGFEIKVPEQYYLQLGYQILAGHDFGYASWTFQQYENAYPSSAHAHVGLADVALMQGQLDMAKQHYNEALKLDPEHIRASTMIESVSAGN